MTDRELLELAAKAAGYDLAATKEGYPMFINGRGIWSPLEDDGDALRLAVKLGMNLVICDELGVTDARVPSRTGWCTEQHWDTSASAARRAIVRAAAEIGRAMP